MFLEVGDQRGAVVALRLLARVHAKVATDFPKSGSWGNISCVVRRQTGTRERENGRRRFPCVDSLGKMPGCWRL